MPVGKVELPEMHPVEGFYLGVTRAGIKKPDHRDVVVMEFCEGAQCAAVFTSNAFCAAPVLLCREHLAKHPPRYLLVNTGNANAGTGAQGLQDSRDSCAALAQLVGIPAEAVLPFSTGVIGEKLPVEKIITALPDACANLSAVGWVDAAHGILTTDTVPKGASIQRQVAGKTVTVTGISKGSGMIRPDMATMLAYVATDASVEKNLLQQCLQYAVDRSFNKITVDGDTSTNDACVLVATAKSELAEINDESSEAYLLLRDAIVDVCVSLAQAIVRDGEGATKLITIDVLGGGSIEECNQVAYTIAHSPLVKTAFFASDPNWGRILAAVGRAGINDLDLEAITINLGDVCIVREGARASDYTEAAGQKVMDEEEITITIDLKRGAEKSTVWTCDFSYDYVRINAEYRS